MTVHEKKAEIIQRFIEHCELSTHQPLGFLGIVDDVWECSSDLEHVVKSLQQEYSVEELVASALMTTNEDGLVELAESLTGECSPIIVLRDSITGEPYELLTKAGCLSSTGLPIFEILRDGRTQQLLAESNRTLFVAFNIEDVLVLRACGIPATLANGLDVLPLEDVDQFCDSFGVTSYKSDRGLFQPDSKAENEDHFEPSPIGPTPFLTPTIARQGIGDSLGVPNDTCHKQSSSTSAVCERLVFIGWSPSLMSDAIPCKLKAVVDYFRQLDRFMDVDLSDLELWEIDQETVERLRFIANRRSAEIFREALLDASDDIVMDLGRFGQEKTKPHGPTADYATAITRLQNQHLRAGACIRRVPTREHTSGMMSGSISISK